MVDMAKKTNLLQRKATQEATSEQSKTGVFKRIKAYSRHKVKAVGTLAAVAALALTLNTTKARAQDYTVVSDSKNKLENTISDPRIVGKKLFDIRVENGIAYFDSVKVDEKRFATCDVTIKIADSAGIKNMKDSDIKLKVYDKIGGRDAVFLFYEHGILGFVTFVWDSDPKKGANYGFVGADGEKVFTHEGGYYLIPGGKGIVASTEKFLLVMTDEITVSGEYAKGFNDPNLLPLMKPIFTIGENNNFVVLRDPVLKMPEGAPAKYIINLKTLDFEKVSDEKTIGVR